MNTMRGMQNPVRAQISADRRFQRTADPATLAAAQNVTGGRGGALGPRENAP